MVKWTGAAALAATAMLAAQPVAAAELLRSNSEQRHGAAFGGLKLSMPIGTRQRAKPTARLQLTYSQHLRDSRTGDVRAFTPPGLQLGASRKGKPMLFVGGQEAAKMKQKLGIGGTGTTIAVVAGVVLVLVIVGSVLAAPADLLNPCDGPDDICDG